MDNLPMLSFHHSDLLPVISHLLLFCPVISSYMHHVLLPTRTRPFGSSADICTIMRKPGVVTYIFLRIPASKLQNQPVSHLPEVSGLALAHLCTWSYLELVH
jgi:hypothetical protein